MPRRRGAKVRERPSDRTKLAQLGPGSFYISSARICCSTNRDIATCPPKVCFLRAFRGSCWFLESVKEVAGDTAEVMEPLDGYYNWDVIVDADFARAKEAVSQKGGSHSFGIHVQILHQSEEDRQSRRSGRRQVGSVSLGMGTPVGRARQQAGGESRGALPHHLGSGDLFFQEPMRLIGLTGKVFDPNVGGQVWRTSLLAAEYPAGLCWAWASAL